MQHVWKDVTSASLDGLWLTSVLFSGAICCTRLRLLVRALVSRANFVHPVQKTENVTKAKRGQRSLTLYLKGGKWNKTGSLLWHQDKTCSKCSHSYCGTTVLSFCLISEKSQGPFNPQGRGPHTDPEKAAFTDLNTQHLDSLMLNTRRQISVKSLMWTEELWIHFTLSRLTLQQ